MGANIMRRLLRAGHACVVHGRWHQRRHLGAGARLYISLLRLAELRYSLLTRLLELLGEVTLAQFVGLDAFCEIRHFLGNPRSALRIA